MRGSEGEGKEAGERSCDALGWRRKVDSAPDEGGNGVKIGLDTVGIGEFLLEEKIAGSL